MDAVSNALVSHSGTAVLATALLRRPWGMAVDPQRHSAIHVVLDGECWLRLAGHEDHIRLTQGDVVLVTRGVGHSLSDPPSAAVAPLRTVLAAAPVHHVASACDATTLLCAKYQLDQPGPHPMAVLMPPVIHLTRRDVLANEPLRLVLELLRVEAQAGRPDTNLIASRLLDSALVLLLRAWIDSRPEGGTEWYGALKDPAIARALRLIHEQPAQAWTIAKLANQALLSRATFARRFRQLVGEPPLGYVARVRMNLAAKALRQPHRSIEEIAHAIGYESGAAFSKAFRRIYGQSPGRYRYAVASISSAHSEPRRRDIGDRDARE